jgi:hypothetical protein
MKGTYQGGQFMTLPLAQPASNEPLTRTISRRVAVRLLPPALPKPLSPIAIGELDTSPTLH